MDLAERHRAINLGNDRRLFGIPSFKKLLNPRQTTGDVLRLGGFTRDLHQGVSRVNRIPIADDQMRARRQEITTFRGFVAHENRRRPLFLGRSLDHDPMRKPRDLIGLLADILTLDDVVVLGLTADLRQNRGGERIPFDELRIGLDLLALMHPEARTVGDGVALQLASLGVGDDDLTVTVDHHQVARLRIDRRDVNELDQTGVF